MSPWPGGPGGWEGGVLAPSITGDFTGCVPCGAPSSRSASVFPPSADSTRELGGVLCPSQVTLTCSENGDDCAGSETCRRPRGVARGRAMVQKVSAKCPVPLMGTR